MRSCPKDNKGKTKANEKGGVTRMINTAMVNLVPLCLEQGVAGMDTNLPVIQYRNCQISLIGNR